MIPEPQCQGIMSARFSMSIPRDAIAERILKGQNVVIYNGHVLLIPDKWLNAHPGGALAILHFVGRDATDEIDSYHPPATVDLIRKYSIGTVAVPWEPFLPPISIGWVRRDNQWHNDAVSLPHESELLLVQQTQSATPLLSAASLIPPTPPVDPKTQIRLSTAYKALHQRVIDAGYYETPYLTGIAPELFRYALLTAISAYTYYKDWQLISAVALGLLWHQLMFMAHDLGHMGVTHSWAIDRLLSIFIADFVGGLSIGWWVEVRVSRPF